MNILISINRVLLITTFILFATIYLGFMAEIILGSFQILCSLIILLNWKKINHKSRKNLKIYWFLTLLYAVGFFIDWGKLSDYFIPFFIGLAIIPMGLAVYFTKIIENIKKQLL